MVNFILGLIIIHIICDFVLQSKLMVVKKNEGILFFHFLHSFIHLFFSFIYCYFFTKNFLRSLFLSILIFVFHFIIDLIKSYTNAPSVFLKIRYFDILRRLKLYLLNSTNINIRNYALLFNSTNAYLTFLFFILDQFFHVFSLVFLANIFFKNKLISYAPETTTILIYILTFLFISFVSGVLIFNCLNIVYYKIPSYNEDMKELTSLHTSLKNKRKIQQEKKLSDKFDSLSIGKSIGILERIIIFICILLFGLKECGFIITGVLTVKSLTRFKLLEIKVFSEYYFLGTILSYIFILLPFFIAHFIKDKILFVSTSINILSSFSFIDLCSNFINTIKILN